MHRAFVSAVVVMSLSCQHPVGAKPTASAAVAPSTPAFAHDVVSWWFAGDDQALWDHSSAEMRAAFGSVQTIGEARAAIAAEFGQETNVVLEETLQELDGVRSYYRDAKYSGTEDTITMSVVFDSTPQIVGLRFDPWKKPAPSDHEDYRTKATLRLPIDGPWFVAWGGRSVRHNYHAEVRDQRYAYDLLVAREGKTYANDGRDLTDYYCFGQPIVAPAAGTIVTAVDGLRDNPIGKTDRDNAAGNHVVIDHGGREYSVLAHLKQGSVAVKAGATIKSGTRVGLCGNSGNTSEPHLHYHLQDGPTLFQAAGLPAQFQRYVADDQPVARGEPHRGQIIKN